MDDPSRPDDEHDEHLEDSEAGGDYDEEITGSVASARLRTKVAQCCGGQPPRDGREHRRYRPTARGETFSTSSSAIRSVRVDAPADLGTAGPGWLAKKVSYQTEANGAVSQAITASTGGPSSGGAGGHYRRR
jgi:hypothetical protein